MANLKYDSFKLGLMKGVHILDEDTVMVALVTSSYTPSAAHDTYEDITNQVSGDGYTAGGTPLVNPDTTVVSNVAVFDAEDTEWANSTITARGAILYKYIDDDGSPAANSPLICYFDFGEDKVSTSGTFTIAWNAGGILTLA